MCLCLWQSTELQLSAMWSRLCCRKLKLVDDRWVEWVDRRNNRNGKNASKKVWWVRCNHHQTQFFLLSVGKEECIREVCKIHTENEMGNAGRRHQIRRLFILSHFRGKTRKRVKEGWNGEGAHIHSSPKVATVSSGTRVWRERVSFSLAERLHQNEGSTSVMCTLWYA